MSGPPIPAALADSIAGWEDETAARWREELPARLERLSATWEVELGPPFEPGGVTAWVAPAGRGDGTSAVVKVVIPHREATHEAAALTAWDGGGAVRLLAHEPAEHALLLERCDPGTPLSELDDPEEIVDVAAGVLRRLWTAPTEGAFEPLADVAGWFAGLVLDRHQRVRHPLPAAIVERAVEVLRTLPASADRAVLLHHDFHPGNVLRAERGWLAIDPKPQVGDPAFDPVQLVLQSSDPLLADDPPSVVERRVHRLAELLDVDPGRLAAWGLARCVEWSLYCLDNRMPVDGARHAGHAELFAPLSAI